MDGQAYTGASRGEEEGACDAMPPYVTGSQRTRRQEHYTHTQKNEHAAWAGDEGHRYPSEYADVGPWLRGPNRGDDYDRSRSPVHTTQPDHPMYYADRQHSAPHTLARHYASPPIQHNQPQYPDIQTHRPEVVGPPRNSRVYMGRTMGEAQSFADNPHSVSFSEPMPAYAPSEPVYSQPGGFSRHSSMSDGTYEHNYKFGIQAASDPMHVQSYQSLHQQPQTVVNHRNPGPNMTTSAREHEPVPTPRMYNTGSSQTFFADPIRKVPLERQHSFPPRTRAHRQNEGIHSPMSLTPSDHSRPSDAMNQWDGSSQRNERFGSQQPRPYDRASWSGSPVRGWDRSPPHSTQSFTFQPLKDTHPLEPARRMPARRFTLASELTHRSTSFPDVNFGSALSGSSLGRRSPPPPGHPYTPALHTTKRNPANTMMQDAESASGSEQHVRDIPETSPGNQQPPPLARKIDRRWGRKGSITVDMAGFVCPEPARPENNLLEEVRKSFASVCKHRGDVSLVMRVVVGIHKTSDFCDEMNSYSWSTHLGCIQKLLGMLPEERKGCDYHEATVNNIVRFWGEKLMRYGDRQARNS